MANDLAIDGLASGLPTSELIERLMEIERLPVKRLETQKNTLQQIRDAWRDINMRLSNLANRLSPLKLSATFDSRTVTSSDEKVATATATTEAELATYHVVVHQLAQAHRVASDGSTTKVTRGGKIKIGLATITIEDGWDLRQIAQAINAAEGAGVKASVIKDTLVLEATETGVEIEVVEDPAGVLQQLGIYELREDGTKGFLNVLQEAREAEFSINGVKLTSKSNTVTGVVQGITFQLHREGGEATLQVRLDVDRAVQAIQAFVDQYNSAMQFIQSRLEYNAETGTAGLLQGNSTLIRIQTMIRRAVTDAVATDGPYNAAASIGISVDRYGVMTLDAAKLREALQADPAAVAKLFQARAEEDGFDGIATRLDTYLQGLLQANTGVIPKQVEAFDSRMDAIDDRIEAMERRLEMVEQRYYRQFLALEQALSQLLAQQDWLTNQLAVLNNMQVTRTRR